jgi:hypothetical protein
VTSVFFSWQVDTPTRSGRNFVERALERAIARIGKDATVEDAVRDELQIDRDTKGVPGSPPITDTIFRKIDQAAVFVPDLTFVGKRIDGRPTPNPNVLIEYGWALRSLTHVRIVPVMNVAFGKPTSESMPFDLRHLRHPITFDCLEDADDETRKQVRDKLAHDLENAILGVLGSKEFKNRLPKRPELPAFTAKQPADGPGRFRLVSAPIGVTEDRLISRSQHVRLSNGPVIWLRLMPTFDLGRTWLIRELRDAGTSRELLLLLIFHELSHFGYLRSDDGFAVYAVNGESPDMTSDVVIAFTSGEIWATDAYTLDALMLHNQKAILLREDDLAKALARYCSVLAKLGVTPRAVQRSLLNVMENIDLRPPRAVAKRS